MTLRKPNKNALEAVLTFWPTSRETWCFRQKDGGVLIKGSTKCSLIKDEEENYLLINVHRAELLILLTDSFNLKPHYVKQTSPQATNTQSFGWYDIAFLQSSHSYPQWAKLSPRFSSASSFSVLFCSSWVVGASAAVGLPLAGFVIGLRAVCEPCDERKPRIKPLVHLVKRLFTW